MKIFRDRDDVSSWDTAAKPYRLAGRLSTCSSSHAPRRVHNDPLGAMGRALVPLLPASLRRGVLILQLVRTNRMFLFLLTPLSSHVVNDVVGHVSGVDTP